MLLLAGFEALLHRLSGQRDFVVGAAVAGRDRVEIEGLIGCFINLLALRVTWQGNPRFRELLARVREVSLGAFAHQDLPFDRLVAELRPERQGGSRPLVTVAFGVQNAPRGLPELPGLELEMLEFADGVARFDLTLWMNERPDGLSASWTYSSDLFEAATVERLHERFVSLLGSAVADPAARLDALEIRTAAEQAQGTQRERQWRELRSNKLRGGVRQTVRAAAEEEVET
jgi:non-ribosomal peptide synthetase component F